MKVSPDFSHQLLWFVFGLLKVLLLSFGAGLLLTIGSKNLEKAWKNNRNVKVWLYISGCCFVLYVFFIGIK